MSIALVDMDQTLCDYEGTVRNKLAELYPGEEDAAMNGSLDSPRFKPAVDLIKKVPGFWRTLPKIEMGFKIVELLRKYNFEVHILSKGPYRTTQAWSEKVDWIREHLPGTPITITENKGLVYGKVLVDDWMPYCEQWLQHRPRGMVIMPACYYNVGFENKYPGQVIRATGDNWAEVEEVIKKVSERQPGEEL